MADSINNLLELADLAQDHGPAELAEWIDAGICEWMNSGGSLEQALGLTCAPGKRSARGQYLKHKQRQHLREAWDCVGPELAPWPRAGWLAEAIANFEASKWPAWCELDHPPEGSSALRSALFHARRCGELPQGQRRLHDLLKQATETSSRAWFSKPLV